MLDPAITVEAGTTEEWVVENWTNELHAFSIHQVHFRLLEIDGEKLAEPALLDVVNVAFGIGPRICGNGSTATLSIRAQVER